MLRKIFAGFFMLACIVSVFAAEVPIIDYSTDANVSKPTMVTEPRALGFNPPRSTAVMEETSPAPMTGNLNLQQRMSRVEQQINNINQQNLINKIEELQQRVQKLNGQIEDQTHQIEQLNVQVRDFYQDLDKRIEKKEATSSVVKESDNAMVKRQSDPVSAKAGGVPFSTGEIIQAPTLSNSAKNNVSHQNVSKDKVKLQEQQLYQKAIDLLPSKKFEESSNKLRAYLKAYPKGMYVANSHYWLGEINFLQKNYDAAEEEFKIVVSKFSKSKRIADAMFKLALVHQHQGREVQAQAELKQIIKQHPNSTAAQLARSQIDGN